MYVHVSMYACMNVPCDACLSVVADDVIVVLRTIGGDVMKGKGSSIDSGGKKPFDKMNNIVAHMMVQLTSSSRFEGSLNMDINEITTNLVPFPNMHFLLSSLAPLYSLADVALPPRR